jgi:hypothetical protein
MTNFTFLGMLFECHEGFLFLLLFSTPFIKPQTIGDTHLLLLKSAWVRAMNSFMVVYFKLMSLIQICTLIGVMAYHI